MKNKDWREILEGLKNKVDNIKEDISLDLEIMFSDKKEAIAVWKWVKRIALIGIGALITTTVTVSNGEYIDMKEELSSKYEKQIQYTENWKEKSEDLQDENNELSKQVKIAKEYLELDENEKVLVDAKIEEVNKETEERIIRENVKEYIDIINSKNYYDMTSGEKTMVTVFLDSVFNELPDKLKSEYQPVYDKAKQSKEEGEAKIQAEEEAKKQQQEEEARKQLEYSNCIKTAKSYIKYMAFSRTGLIKQLEFEGYSNEAAAYSVDSLNINWNEQCAKKAESYLNYSSFSRDGLYNQLVFEGFTDEQIQYGLSAVGY